MVFVHIFSRPALDTAVNIVSTLETEKINSVAFYR